MIVASFDFDEHERMRAWRYAYLGRYMRVAPEQVDRMPIVQTRDVTRALSDIIRAESGKKAETNHT